MEVTLMEYMVMFNDMVGSTFDNNMATEIPSGGTSEANDVCR
jgi:hypothetical protein